MAEPVLKKGSNDPAVRDLQAALKALGHDPGPIDGVFGPTTEAAVKAFQQEREIPADGVVGRVTWINIDEADQSEPTLTLGASGLPVRRAQKRMSLVGYQVGGVDGRYGSKTEAAVKQLQQQHAITADGGRRTDVGRHRRAGRRRARELTQQRSTTCPALSAHGPWSRSDITGTRSRHCNFCCVRAATSSRSTAYSVL